MWTTDDALELYCRLGLLAVAILHWIVFALMVAGAEGPISNQAPHAYGNLASFLSGQPLV